MNMTRLELAQKISENYNKSPNFLLDIPPRVGKSIISTELIRKWAPGRILILSGALTTNQQWRENLSKYNPDILDRCDIMCYQSAHKVEDVYDVICLDELDLITQGRFENLQGLNPKHWIGMSGTLEDEDVEFFRLLTKGKFYKETVTFNEAVDWGILPAPKIYAVALDMDNTHRYLLYYNSKDKKKQNVVTSYPNRWNYIKDKKCNVLIQCTEVEYHNLICAEFNRWKSYEDEFNLPYEQRSSTIKFLQDKGFNKTTCRDKKMRLGNERKKFFADIKNRHFKKLFAQLPQGSRTLIFCQDITQADLLNKEYSVHSKKDSLTNDELIDKFNKKEISNLFSINKLSRGVDFIDVDYLVILQSSMKQGTQVQKFARSGLSIAPKTILFYYPGTQDEKYINEFIKEFKPEWVIKRKL